MGNIPDSNQLATNMVTTTYIINGIIWKDDYYPEPDGTFYLVLPEWRNQLYVNGPTGPAIWITTWETTW